MGGVFAIFIILPLYFGLIALAIVQYILTAKSLQQIANRRGVANGWMAWIPVANSWAIGSIVDDYDNRLGIKSNWKKALLTMQIIAMGIVFVLYFFALFMAILASALVFTEELGVAIIFFVYIVLFVVLMLAMALAVCQAICIYKIFESTVPEKAIKYIILYLIVPLAGGICLWKCKDQGYSKPEEIEVAEESAHE